MADKRRTKDQDNVLVNTAKVIGTAAGKVALLVSAAPDETPLATKSVKKEKLPKKDQPHLPRRLKKAQKKTAARSSQGG
jgi:hypothetical protein